MTDGEHHCSSFMGRGGVADGNINSGKQQWQAAVASSSGKQQRMLDIAARGCIAHFARITYALNYIGGI